MRLGIVHSEVRKGTEKNGIPRKNCFLKVIRVFFFVLEWFKTSHKFFLSRLMVCNEILSGFSSKRNRQERNSELFHLLQNGSGQNYEVLSVFLFYERVSERNSELFYLRGNGLERNSERFPFRKTDRKPTEFIKISVWYVFRRIMFLSENGNPTCNPGLQEIQVEAERIHQKN